MPAVTIDLQDGFTGDDVVVKVNGVEVQRHSGVRTKRTLGLAKSLPLDVPEGKVTLEVAVPSRGIAGAVDLEHKQIGVSVSGNAVQFIQSDREFGYG